MYKTTKKIVSGTLDEIKSAGLFKNERIITSRQGSRVCADGREGLLNFCANNYLGLSGTDFAAAAAKEGIDKYGFGLSSVRFICGTQDVHKQLEKKVSQYLSTDDTILYTSCFDANGGLFETLTTEQDAIISDELNHASIVDGVRLSKAMRLRYKNNDMQDLAAKLAEAEQKGARQKIIVTDGVFSMDGIIANIAAICDLADKHDALVVVDDSHATGFVGKTGRGSFEHAGAVGRVDVITGTFGKALGGASGGFTSGRKEIIELLRQRSRPYLFSNTLAPSIAYATIKVIEHIETHPELVTQLRENAALFRRLMEAEGFTLAGAGHPIIPVMLGDAVTAQKVAQKMLEKGVYVVGFFYPVVPQGKARVRTQMSAAHTAADITRCVQAFAETKKELKI